jgi:hypothetical protein
MMDLVEALFQKMLSYVSSEGVEADFWELWTTLGRLKMSQLPKVARGPD